MDVVPPMARPAIKADGRAIRGRKKQIVKVHVSSGHINREQHNLAMHYLKGDKCG